MVCLCESTEMAYKRSQDFGTEIVYENPSHVKSHKKIAKQCFQIARIPLLASLMWFRPCIGVFPCLSDLLRMTCTKNISL